MRGFVMRIGASAAIGIISRRGGGKLRHIHTNELWFQENTASNEFYIENINGEVNIVDLGTKLLTVERITKLMHIMKLEDTPK